MRSREIFKLVEGTADAAFASDGLGLISAWNDTAKELFGLSSEQVIGRPCHEILQGANEVGAVCSSHCVIQQAAQGNCPLPNFDLQVETSAGRQWCNVSVLIVTEYGSSDRHVVHIVRPREMRKRLERFLRDFVVAQSALEPQVVETLISSRDAVAHNLRLTGREMEILQMLATGTNTDGVAKLLSISRLTVKKHVAHILTKLDAHSRLEAIRRAEKAGLI